MDKFDKIGLPDYYEKFFPMITVDDSEEEELQLQKTCGLAYVERIIAKLTTGGNLNGTSIY